MIQIYYGDGKGKTTAAVGAAVRAAGNGINVLFLQFLKNGDSGECKILKNISGIEFRVASVDYKLFEKIDNKRKDEIKSAYDRILLDAAEKNYDMIIMDEVLDAHAMKLISDNLFNTFLSDSSAEIILTGHSVSAELISLADYVTEMKKIKHPFYSGIKARKGIEF